MTESEGAATPARTILDVLWTAHRRHPGLTALAFEDGTSISVAEIVARVERFAGFLSVRIARGDRVAIMLANRTEFFVAWFAVAACGGVLVGLNPSLQTVDARHILQDSEARLAVVGKEEARLLQEVRAECPALAEVLTVADDGEPGGLDNYVGQPFDLADAAALAEPTDVVNIFYTSGTTGAPKGCMVDHTYWLRFLEAFMLRYPLDSGDRLLCCLQFFYNDPPWQLLLSLSVGSTLVAMRRFSVRRFWPVVEANDVTVIFSIAGIAGLLLKAQAVSPTAHEKVRLAVHVGIPPSIHQDLMSRWPFPWVECYGLTESGIVVSMPLEHAKAMAGSGSIGLPLPDVEVRVVDEAMVDVPRRTAGELLVHAPAMMRGYLNRPEESAAALNDGWLRTGDLVEMDDEGFLYFRGRMKDIVRRGGENISCAEVEHVLRSHPRVLDAAIVPVPDDVRGEECLAWIVPVVGETMESVSPNDLIEFCSSRLAPYKVPRYFAYRRNDFPRTPSMRVKKAELAKQPDRSTWDRVAVLGW